MENLQEEIIKRHLGIKAPSSQWIRLQLTPQNPYANSAMHYTGCFAIKYVVQVRQVRAEHEDSKFAYHHYLYLKHYTIKWRHNLFCLWLIFDDHVISSVGFEGPCTQRE